jgi:hypothetical protein
LFNNLRVLEKYISAVDFKTVFFYSESNFFFFYSYLGILKFNTFLFSFFFFKKKNLIFKYYKNNIMIVNSFIDIIYGNTIKFKVIGLGSKLFYCDNLFLFKLGYSHLIFFFFFFFNSKRKLKKKKYFKIFSFSKIKLYSFFYDIQFLRYPHIYSKNGIFNKDDLFFFKKGKKSFLL